MTPNEPETGRGGSNVVSHPHLPSPALRLAYIYTYMYTYMQPYVGSPALAITCPAGGHLGLLTYLSAGLRGKRVVKTVADRMHAGGTGNTRPRCVWGRPCAERSSALRRWVDSLGRLRQPAWTPAPSSPTLVDGSDGQRENTPLDQRACAKRAKFPDGREK